LVNVWWTKLWECFHCSAGEPFSHSQVVEWIFGSRPAEVLGLPAGEHRQVRDGLRTGRIVVEHDENAAGGGHRGGDLGGIDDRLRRELSQQVGLSNHGVPFVAAVHGRGKNSPPAANPTAAMRSSLGPVNGCRRVDAEGDSMSEIAILSDAADRFPGGAR